PAFAPVRAGLQLRGGAGTGAAGQGGDRAGANLRSVAAQGREGVSGPDDPVPDLAPDLVRAVEAALFAAEQPLTAEQLSTHLGGADVRAALAQLQAHYAGRGIH